MTEGLSPACQIHHTNSDHWVVSFQENENNIYVFDSIWNERSDNNILTDSLKLQLASVYGGSKQSLHITVPDTHRQNNGVDCGLYAIAHLVEFCVHGRPMPNIIFDTSKMRSHLIHCLENQHLSEFPKDFQYTSLLYLCLTRWSLVGNVIAFFTEIVCCLLLGHLMMSLAVLVVLR